MHTSIGLLALAISLVEENPHKPSLSRLSPFYAALHCQAENNAEGLPKSLRRLIKKSLSSNRALKKLETAVLGSALNSASAKQTTALLSTTQAVDLIEGGVKVNALPERASAVVNHRIAIERSAAPSLKKKS